MNCSQNFTFNHDSYELQPYGMWANKHIPAKGAQKYDFSVQSSCGASINYKKNITAYEKEVSIVNYDLLSNHDIKAYICFLDK